MSNKSRECSGYTAEGQGLVSAFRTVVDVHFQEGVVNRMRVHWQRPSFPFFSLSWWFGVDVILWGLDVRMD